MALNANQSKNTSSRSSNREPLQGTFPARLVMVVDLGLQPQRPFQGKEKAPAYDVWLGYELVDEFLKDENGEDDPTKPRWLGEQMSLFSLEAEKAKSTLRYKALDPTISHGGDWPALINTPCMVTVVNNPGKGKNAGKVYEKVAGVTSMRAKDAARTPELVNEPIVFDTDAPDVDTFKRIPAFLQDKIKNNLEYKGSKLEALLKDVVVDNKPETKVEEQFEPDPDMDDEIPF